MHRTTAVYVCGWNSGRVGWERGGFDVCRYIISNETILLSQCQRADIDVSRLGAIYRAGDLKMSTWIPFIWALINVLVLILSSFSMQGGL